MNSEIEKCRQCLVQCKLEDKSDKIIQLVQGEEIDPGEARDRIGRMTQMANKLGCPPSEIRRVRTKTRNNVLPASLNHSDVTLLFRKSENLRVLHYPTSSPNPDRYKMKRRNP